MNLDEAPSTRELKIEDGLRRLRTMNRYQLGQVLACLGDEERDQLAGLLLALLKSGRVGAPLQRQIYAAQDLLDFIAEQV